VKMLEQLGYVVLAAASGTEALELSKAQSGTIALLLTDVVMPKHEWMPVGGRIGPHTPGYEGALPFGIYPECRNPAGHHGCEHGVVAQTIQPRCAGENDTRRFETK